MGPLFKNVTGRKVLIIDDEVDLCLLVRAYFLRKDCQVHISHTWRDALNSLRLHAPEIVLVDKAFCRDRKATIQSILEAAPSVQLIVSEGYMIYSNCDFL